MDSEILLSDALSRLDPVLLDDTVIVFSLAVDRLSPQDWEPWYSLLNPAEYNRARAFYFPADQCAYVAAHALLRSLLSALLHNNPAYWRFATGEFGKPYLANPPSQYDLRFNLSHCRNRVAVALTLGAEVGVDVEAFDRAAHLDLEIADAYFAPDEVAALHAISDEMQRREQFLQLWILKEACIKATGRGLSQPLDTFTINLNALSIRSQQFSTMHWHLMQWSIEQSQLAVAVDWPYLTPPHFIHQCFVSISELLTIW